jgi:hypothetical protein
MGKMANFTQQSLFPEGMEWEARRAPELFWAFWRGRKSLSVVENRTTISRSSSPYASHYADCANPAATGTEMCIYLMQ